MLVSFFGGSKFDKMSLFRSLAIEVRFVGLRRYFLGGVCDGELICIISGRLGN